MVASLLPYRGALFIDCPLALQAQWVDLCVLELEYLVDGKGETVAKFDIRFDCLGDVFPVLVLQGRRVVPSLDVGSQ